MRTITILSILFLYCLSIKAQTNEAILINEKYTITSPNIASLGKFGSYPVELTSGLPIIDIPIYTIKTKHLELPISISYHASGVKVGEIASWVGLGWALNAGGAIMVNMRGKGDIYGQQIQSAEDLNKIKDGNTLLGWFDYYMRGAKDPEMDMYFYTVSANIKGAFTYNHTGSLIQLPETDSKIEYQVKSEEYIIHHE